MGEPRRRSLRSLTVLRCSPGLFPRADSYLFQAESNRIEAPRELYPHARHLGKCKPDLLRLEGRECTCPIQRSDPIVNVEVERFRRPKAEALRDLAGRLPGSDRRGPGDRCQS